jgi:hypothetical protein
MPTTTAFASMRLAWAFAAATLRPTGASNLDYDDDSSGASDACVPALMRPMMIDFLAGSPSDLTGTLTSRTAADAIPA